MELFRKLLLTSCLALIAQGTAAQVVAGVLIAFFALLLNLQLRPFASPALRVVNIMAQLNLFFVLFVGLCLKVQIRGDSSADVYNAVVACLTLLPVLLPALLAAYIKLGGPGRDEMGEAADGWSIEE